MYVQIRCDVSKDKLLGELPVFDGSSSHHLLQSNQCMIDESLALVFA